MAYPRQLSQEQEDEVCRLYLDGRSSMRGIARRFGVGMQAVINCVKRRGVHRPKPTTVADRFWPKVDRRGPDDCWPWLANRDTGGYGLFWHDNAMRHASRTAYALVHGDVPDGLVIDHLCRNRICVNPAHLEAVTQHENIMRSDTPSALNARKTHCIRGHAFTPENTLVTRKGARVCRECSRTRWARRAEQAA